jgi:hypothetical protein
MRLALIALLLVLPAASSGQAPVAPGDGKAAKAPICGRDLKVRPVRPGEGMRAKRLGELPPGDLTLTVVNRVGDCIEPLVVRQRYGAIDSGQGR